MSAIKWATHTVFSQPFLLTIHCDAANIPGRRRGIHVLPMKRLAGWVGINSTYNAQTGDVSANVNHFTLFAGMLKNGTKQPSLSGCGLRTGGG